MCYKHNFCMFNLFVVYIQWLLGYENGGQTSCGPIDRLASGLWTTWSIQMEILIIVELCSVIVEGYRILILVENKLLSYLGSQIQNTLIYI